MGSYCELFGGLGLTAAMIRARNPRWHLIIEREPVLALHLRVNGFWSELGDAFDRVGQLTEPLDLVDADFGRFTVLHWERDEAVRGFCSKLFSPGHRYVMFTDESKSRLGVNREKYAAVTRQPIRDLADYVNGWSQLWYQHYGYSIIAAEFNTGATYTLWEQVPHLDIVPNRTQASYPGVVPVL